MGQKVNPHGLRVGVIKDWDSRWYASDEEVGDLLVEDHKIRNYRRPCTAPVFPRSRSSGATKSSPSSSTAPGRAWSSARAASRSSSIVSLWRS